MTVAVFSSCNIAIYPTQAMTHYGVTSTGRLSQGTQQSDEKNGRAVPHSKLKNSLKIHSLPGDRKCGFIMLASIGSNHGPDG
jgi:hypothetical protein